MQYARKQYMDQLIKKKDNGRVKVITGLRRSGKSYFLFNLFHQYLLDSGIGDASWVVATHDTTHDVEQEATQEDKLVVFCDEERFRQEMMDF